MKIVRRSEHVETVSYERMFNFASRGNARFVHGYGFTCDKDGNVDRSKLNPVALKNFEGCLVGSVDGEAVVEVGVHKFENSYRIPAVGQCNRCNREVELSGFTNTCECGADYNSAGQELAPREQWGEETGEHWSDIMRPDYDLDGDDY